MIDIERERQRHRRREKQAPCREPNVGLDPGTPGSHPGPKAGAQPLSHPGLPTWRHFDRVAAAAKKHTHTAAPPTPPGERRSR